MTVEYDQFLQTKLVRFQAEGIEPRSTGKHLYPFQSDIVRWALSKGRACIFADCGLGKTLMQLEWASQLPGESLILAPLAVSNQTVREAERFGYRAKVVSRPDDLESGVISVTNYEKLERFDPESFVGIVLDESSILKSYTGAYRNQIISRFAAHPFKLACTATPAPNDFMELGNHAEFVGAMTRMEMLAMFFVHDGGSTQNWRLKGHAREEFWRWVSSWAVLLTKPSQLGYDDDGFILPGLHFATETVESRYSTGALFHTGKLTLEERRAARRESMKRRCWKAAEIANQPGQWLVWCDLNAESALLTDLIDDAVEVKGSDSDTHKATSMLDFAEGKIRVLVTKPRIAGFGMNWQSCHQMIFVGLSDSYEALYQATRRCWRFGQQEDVTAIIVTSEAEGAVLDNVMRKESDHREMQERLASIAEEFSEVREHHAEVTNHHMERVEGDAWEMIHGDCVDVLRSLEAESVDYSVFSPPFASLYVYSDNVRDMGNCIDSEQFFQHYTYVASELLRVLKPGRLVSQHCMLLPTSKVRDGYIGLYDFRGDLIRCFEAAGWIFHSEVVIWKDPVTAMQRTKALGLLHKQIRKDSSMSRQGIPDYVITMRKPGENPDPISHDPNDFPVSLWQKWASPIWSDINPNETLQYMGARENDDERHICPLQLEVIRRCLGLWSNPGDLILSPFAGIGSEGHEAIKFKRRFVGIELKRSYFEMAVKNLRETELATNQMDMFR